MTYKLQSILVLVTLVGLATVSCGKDESEANASASSGSADSSQAPNWADDEPLAPGPAPGADHYPCSVITQAEVEELLGNPLEYASYAVEEILEIDGGFQTESCSWLSFAEDSNEVTLHVSQTQHFPGGSILCSAPEVPTNNPENDGAEEKIELVQPISELGDRAWWIYDQVIGIGYLQACSDQARVAVEVSISRGDQDLALAASRFLVTQALADLDS